MASFNKVILMGNLTRDVELRVTPSGMNIGKLSIAMNRVFTVNQERREEVTFVECDCFGKVAENIARYFKRGKPILIEGRLKLDQWEDKTTGDKRSKLGVVIETFSFVGGGKGDSSDSGAADDGYSPPDSPGMPPPPPPPPPPPRVSVERGGYFNQKQQELPQGANLDDDVPF